ncbi:DNase I-like protein [Basidiobolus meristosporus CBS 931.73]|uniref:DNase I-like protein n=1 Tax=Basidiobolus meristosporus CBS 931.73 TaxID=1314790 RepID=A0A1Y1YP15_9FUNG|nr:DNase I-like protein [Basidiobolus meristosporus CBS 931.73]|eukprot:ORX99573.1 DNase I-like protein [Basidiobolus meristosporus CBS 931.73]
MIAKARMDAFVSEAPEPQGIDSVGGAPPTLPPKPALPQKWANNNFGHYNSAESNAPFEPSDVAPPIQQYTNTTDSDSNSDDAGPVTQQPLFPDQTYANRRAPELPDQAVRLQHKNAPKRFSIAGNFVITGHVAVKAWNMTTKESFPVCHEDGRVSAICPCPSADAYEGKLFWCGLLDGTLIEINTETLKVTNRISSAHNSPVNHILRYRFQLWTIDDNGGVRIWLPDANKELSLFRKLEPVYIAKKQPVAIVVRNELWTAKDKNINIYEYRESQTGISLEQIAALDVGIDIGTVNCVTKNRDGTLVYTGHLDGKVMIWDTTSHSCVRVVPVSNYRICSLLCVRERYLWAGFATGRIYIYDMSYDHWIVVKNWEAHHSSPVNQLKLNTTSVFVHEEVQIASFSEDGAVKIWDGMLTSDWKEKEMLQRDAEFCRFRDIKVLICSWNIDARKPHKFEHENLRALEAWLSTVKDPDIIVVGFQETVDLESKKVTAKSILKFKNKKNSEEQWTHRYKQWQEKLTEAIARAGHDSQYSLEECQNLIGLFSCVFVKTSEKSKIRKINAGKVKTGFGGLHGNKGAIAIRLLYEDSSLCFVNCHLAAGQSHVLQRNNDVATILQSSMFEAVNEDKFVFVKGGNGTLITDHGYCFWSGDLNYRIDLPRDQVIKLIAEKKWDALYEYDQLHREQSENLAFMLRSFTEGPIHFAPTYKYDRDTDVYDTSEKQRIPAWCDRVLYRGERIQQHGYRRHELNTSDHRPISAVFTATVKTVIGNEYVQRVWDEVDAAWADYLRRIIHRSKENWLIECGYPREVVKQVLENEPDLHRAALYLHSQFP